MNKLLPPDLSSISLEQLLQLGDIWKGHSRHFSVRAALSTGHEELNTLLMHRGWPLGSFVEVCQQGMQGEWQLFTPSLLELPGLIVLLNPPAEPFSQAFIQAGIDLERLLVVSAPAKEHFMASFVELARANVGAVLAWQPQDSLTYTELRKCHLASLDGTGLSVLFRPASAQQQSSPATLRLYARMGTAGLEVTVFKQKGHLQMHQARPVVLPLPERWQPALPHHALNSAAPQSGQGESPLPLTRLMPGQGKP